MEWILGPAQAVGRAGNFKVIGRLRPSGRKRRRGAAAVLAGMLLSPWLIAPAKADQAADVAARIKAAPDAITLKCVNKTDTNYVTISRQLHALVFVNTLTPDTPEVFMNDVSTGDGTAQVAFLDDSVRWQRYSQTYGGWVRGHIDRRTLEMAISQQDILEYHFSCIRVENRNQF
jgi:hypothetical protein